ncbi:MAG: hypothetical protein JXA49_01415 [Actinobacteria bacterium]|nr:hypothetical protein [Actinomycetota bacterium]
MTEIAEHLGIHYSRVSHILKEETARNAQRKI